MEEEQNEFKNRVEAVNLPSVVIIDEESLNDEASKSKNVNFTCKICYSEVMNDENAITMSKCKE